jgi:hypothetical protein
MARQKCAECGVHTVEFGCLNCGSTKLVPVDVSPAISDLPRSLPKVMQMSPPSVRISADLAELPQ